MIGGNGHDTRRPVLFGVLVVVAMALAWWGLAKLGPDSDWQVVDRALLDDSASSEQVE